MMWIYHLSFTYVVIVRRLGCVCISVAGSIERRAPHKRAG